MDTDFYDSEEYNYLMHHGILGMKWGKQNGPPYPLSDAKHDRIVRRYEKKKAKIAKDPEKLRKYADKYNFTNDEIDAALKRIDKKREIDKRIEVPQVTLKGIKKEWAKNAATFEKHFDQFTTEEATLALARLDKRQQAHAAKMKELSRPNDAMRVASDFVGTIASTVGNIAGISRGFKEFKENWNKAFGGYTFDEAHINWLASHNKSPYTEQFIKKALGDGKFTKKEIVQLLMKEYNISESDADAVIANRITKG